MTLSPIYHVQTDPLYYGDVTGYPEDLIPYVDTFCKQFNFHAPEAPRKRNPKGRYAFWVMSLWELKDACGELGPNVIAEYRKDFVRYMQEHNGLAPHTVCSPRSLVNVCAGKAATMRTVSEARGQSVEERVAAWMR